MKAMIDYKIEVNSKQVVKITRLNDNKVLDFFEKLWFLEVHGVKSWKMFFLKENIHFTEIDGKFIAMYSMERV